MLLMSNFKCIVKFIGCSNLVLVLCLILCLILVLFVLLVWNDFVFGGRVGEDILDYCLVWYLWKYFRGFIIWFEF